MDGALVRVTVGYYPAGQFGGHGPSCGPAGARPASSPATQCTSTPESRPDDMAPGSTPGPRQAEAQRTGEPEQLRSAGHDQNNPFLRSASSARLASHLHFGDAESFETGKVAIVRLPLALSHTLWSHLQAQSRSGS